MAGSAPLIVPVFIPHLGCPHRCVFCNQEKITGKAAEGRLLPRLRSEIDAFLAGSRQTGRSVQIAFYGGNFLGLPSERIRMLLDLAREYIEGFRAHGIRFSTRPDTVTPEKISQIQGYPIGMIELGVQSMDDAVLSLSHRGHTAEDSVTAVTLLKTYGYPVGLQLMLGLPGDSEEAALETARRSAELFPEFVRIYPTLVIQGSPLAGYYERGEYNPWPLEKAVTTVKRMFLLFRAKGIRVIRMGLQATADLERKEVILAGPYHPAFGDLVISEVYREKLESAISTIELTRGSIKGASLRLRVHPRSYSNLRGHKNRNMSLLREKFGIAAVEIVTDSTLEEGQVVVTDRI